MHAIIANLNIILHLAENINDSKTINLEVILDIFLHLFFFFTYAWLSGQ